MDEVTLHRAKIDDTGHFIGLKVNTDGSLAMRRTVDKTQAAMYSADDWKELMAWLAPDVKYHLEPLEEPAPEPVKPDTEPSEGEGVKLYRARRKSGSRWVGLSANHGQGISFTRNMSKAIKTTEEVWHRIMKQWATDLVLGLDYELVPVEPGPAEPGSCTDQKRYKAQDTVSGKWLVLCSNGLPQPHTRVDVGLTQDRAMGSSTSARTWSVNVSKARPGLVYKLVPDDGLEATVINTPEELTQVTGCTWIPEGTTTAEELVRKSGIDWRAEGRAISAEEAARHRLNTTPDPEPVESVSKDRALELFLDAIHIGFEANHNKGFNRLEAVHYFSERLKEL